MNVKDKKCIGIKSLDQDISSESLSCLLSTIQPIKISISQLYKKGNVPVIFCGFGELELFNFLLRCSLEQEVEGVEVLFSRLLLNYSWFLQEVVVYVSTDRITWKYISYILNILSFLLLKIHFPPRIKIYPFCILELYVWTFK